MKCLYRSQAHVQQGEKAHTLFSPFADARACAHLTDLRQRKLHTPDLALAPEAILAAQLELRVEALLLERPPRGLKGLPVLKRTERANETRGGQQQAGMSCHQRDAAFLYAPTLAIEACLVSVDYIVATR